MQNFHADMVRKALSDFTGTPPNDTQVSIALLAHKKLIEAGSHYGKTRNFTSFNYIYTFLTGRKIDIRHNGAALRYMAAVTKNAIRPLVEQNVLTKSSLHYSKNAHISRKIELTPEFAQTLETSMKNYVYKALGSSTTVSTNTTKALGWQKDLSRYMDITIATKKKWESSKITIDIEAIRSFDTTVLSAPQLHNLLFGLSTIALTDKEQRQGKVSITNAGRLFTIGGIMNLPRELRKKILKPRDCYSIVDFDLETAQLKLMSYYLNADFYGTLCNLKTSVWEYIGMPFPKDHIKKALYSFMFGSLEENIVQHVKDAFPDTKFDEEALQILLSKLGDLPARRKLWFKQHSKQAIKAMPIRDRKNALGMVFKFNDDETNLPGKMFAHFMQGLEQFVIQSLIANKVDGSQLVTCYDGFLVEIRSDLVKETLRQYNNYVDSLIKGMSVKAEVLTTNGEKYDEVSKGRVQDQDKHKKCDEGIGCRSWVQPRWTDDADGWNRRKRSVHREDEAQGMAASETLGLLSIEGATHKTLEDVPDILPQVKTSGVLRSHGFFALPLNKCKTPLA